MHLRFSLPLWALILGNLPLLSWADNSSSCLEALTSLFPTRAQLQLLDLAKFQSKTFTEVVATLPPIRQVEILGHRRDQEIWRVSFEQDAARPIVVKSFTPVSEKMQHPDGPFSPAPEIIEAEFHRTIKKILEIPTDLDALTKNHFTPLVPEGLQLRAHSVTFQNVSGANLHQLLRDKNLPLAQKQLLANSYHQKVNNLLQKISQVLSQSSTYQQSIQVGLAEKYLPNLRNVEEIYPDLAAPGQINRYIIEFSFRGQFFSLVLTPENIVVSQNKGTLEMYLVNLSL